MLDAPVAFIETIFLYYRLNVKVLVYVEILIIPRNYYNRRRADHARPRRNQSFQTKSSPPLGDRPQKRSKSAVPGYMAEGYGAPGKPPNPAISSPESRFSPNSEDVMPKRSSGFKGWNINGMTILRR
jgi:hypothetical protein